MAKSDISFDLNIDQSTFNFFQREAPDLLQKARKKAVQAAGMAWADQAKKLTRQENHIDTGLYINSIGYSTGTPSQPLNDLTEDRKKTELSIGADVAYAGHLEKQYALFARSLDTAKNRMKNVAETQIKNTLHL